MWVTHAALFALRGYQECDACGDYQRHASACKQRVETEWLVVVERHALVDLEPGLVEPAEAGDIYGLQRAVAPVW